MRMPRATALPRTHATGHHSARPSKWAWPCTCHGPPLAERGVARGVQKDAAQVMNLQLRKTLWGFWLWMWNGWVNSTELRLAGFAMDAVVPLVAAATPVARRTRGSSGAPERPSTVGRRFCLPADVENQILALCW